MKLLTITVPCYNSQEYMRKCIESLLPGGEDVEIIVVDDGSSDKTAEIADEYEALYPTIVRAFHQENGGHGEAVNTGLRNATGKYFKVVDSDDWVDSKSYEKILETLHKFSEAETQIDMLVSNYVYENESIRNKKVIRYCGVLPQNQVFTWNEIGRFKKGQYILMHSVIYRTQLLRDCKLELPKHTFYVDNLFVYLPLPYVKKLYYIDVDFYRYFIGRDDQSVNERNMITRIDQQLYVNKCMMNAYVLDDISEKRLSDYMKNYVEVITVVSTVMLVRSGTDENLEKKKELWSYLKNRDIKLYRRIRMGIMGQTTNLPGRSGRMICVASYKVSQKVIGFN